MFNFNALIVFYIELQKYNFFEYIKHFYDFFFRSVGFA